MSGTVATEQRQSLPPIDRHGEASSGAGSPAWRSIGHGAAAATAMAVFYVVVVRWASGSWSHLADRARQDWYYLVAIVAGFGIQVALVSELRRRRRLGHSAAIVGGLGAGASLLGHASWDGVRMRRRHMIMSVLAMAGLLAGCSDSTASSSVTSVLPTRSIEAGSVDVKLTPGPPSGTATLTITGLTEPIEVTWDIGGT